MKNDAIRAQLRRIKEDVAQLEELVTSLIEDVETYQRLSNEAIKHAVKNTNGSKHAINTIRVLQGMDPL